MNPHHPTRGSISSGIRQRSTALRDDMTASDIEGWDSVAHINLHVRNRTGIRVRFKGNELADMKTSVN